MKNDPIAESMNMQPLEVEVVEEEKALTVSPQVSNDFEYARTNMYQVIEDGTRSLQDLVAIASQSQNPRAYEVVSTMINSLVTANEKLLDLQKKRADIEAGPKGGSGKTINNNIIMTSDQLLTLMKGKKDGDE